MKIKEGLEEEFQSWLEMNSKDGYSLATTNYAQAWADLMERSMVGTAPEVAIPQIAKLASHEADTEGITGFMYGCAVSGLAHFWEHGEILRRWHNKETQIGTEGDEANEKGGVLNPAIISIG